MEARKGRILIDGVDISQVGLNDLRSRLAFIPQDPFIFRATLRENLDPNGIHSDFEIWKILKDVGLFEFINSSMNAGLDTEICNGGSSMSLGQRQLLCLSRAILSNARILICDEASASLDVITDELVQNALNSSLQNSTVFTIAHRLNTIENSDKLLVLNQGRVTYFGCPVGEQQMGELLLVQ